MLLMTELSLMEET